jgi:adenosylcobalamin-dependent ribonucleoside-triphosphate reductase
MSEDAGFLSFHLPDEFIKDYKKRNVPWGFPIGAGNSLGELTFLTKYSRRKADGGKERWWETCQRVIEGMFSIQKDWCKDSRLPWNERKAQVTAQDAYERLFVGKWTPPGRGLWMMGTEFVNGQKNSAALQNCSFISTEGISSRSVHDAIWPFTRLMEMSMLGVGVGFDTKGVGKLEIHLPLPEVKIHVIPDSREGWCDSVAMLLESYFFASRNQLEFDYSEIRPSGEPIKGFGGVAAGPGPLIDLHRSLHEQFEGRSGEKITTTDIVDIQNKIGKCVVAGNVRRSAEIALGEASDKDFLDLKNWEVNPERMGANGWGHTSNNSIVANVGDNFDEIAGRIADNGEPGIVWLDLCRKYGRLVDPLNNKDWRAAGTNPCSEQTLESGECCTLVENFISRHDSLEDFEKTLKISYLYAKSVTLLPTHWPETNAIMQRNRRIGCSVSGLAHFAEINGWTELRTWLDKGYDYIQMLDNKYSEWLGCRPSIKTTSVKPSGTVSLLFGVTPGVHWPTADVYIRRMRLASNDPLLVSLREAGYHTEPDVMDPTHSIVVELPTMGPEVRTEREVSMWEKTSLAILAQRYWADNQVSVTVTFTDEEKSQIGALLRSIDGQLKSVSMLPILEVGGAYKQMPYERIPLEEWEKQVGKVKRIDWKDFYKGNSFDAEGEKFCSNDTCEI